MVSIASKILASMELHRDTPSLLQIGLLFLRLVLQPPFFQQNNLEDFLSDAPTYMYLEQHLYRHKAARMAAGDALKNMNSNLGESRDSLTNESTSSGDTLGVKKSIVKLSSNASKRSQEDDDDEDGICMDICMEYDVNVYIYIYIYLTDIAVSR
jgi:hypothetical protein